MIHINTFCSEYWNNSTRGLFKFRILRFIWIYPEPKISLQRAACASSAAGWPHLVSRNMPSYWFVAVIQSSEWVFLLIGFYPHTDKVIVHLYRDTWRQGLQPAGVLFLQLLIATHNYYNNYFYYYCMTASLV